MVKIDNMAFSYSRGGRKILDGVSVDLPRAQCLAVLGNNGAGKSTLLKCVDHILKPQQGAVLVDGEDILSLSAALPAWARRARYPPPGRRSRR